MATNGMLQDNTGQAASQAVASMPLACAASIEPVAGQVSALLTAPIGIFDSGIGGLSILQHIRALMPDQDLLYFADSGFAPYGEKPEQVIVERSLHIARFLVDQGAQALVVACNTATVAAIRVLREFFPQLPIVGVEPGLKPAAAQSQTRIVGVLATARTLQGEKFDRLHQDIKANTQVQFLLQACNGLAHQIELGELGSGKTVELLTAYITPLLDQGADTLVLGCTHYPFVRNQIERIIASHSARPITLVDTGSAVARQLQRLMTTTPPSTQPARGPAQLKGYTTGTEIALQQAFSRLLNLTPTVTMVDPL